MTTLEYSKRRLGVFLEELSRQKSLDFPYQQSKQALVKIENPLRRRLERLQRLSEEDSDRDTVRTACIQALGDIFEYLQLLGFILRSTAVRNAFEIHGPLLNLSRRILAREEILVLSSEWNYSPFTYHGNPELRGVVLMGLPAPESANPLLIPLTGHELGHPVWSQKGPEETVKRELQANILREIRANPKNYTRLLQTANEADLDSVLSAKQAWLQAYEWGLSQAKETFCDLLGLRIFGESFLHAFAYLLAPGGYRPPTYPKWTTRVNNLLRAADAYRISAPVAYGNLFDDSGEEVDAGAQTAILQDLADIASQSVVPLMIDLANKQVTDAGVPEGSQAAVKRIYDDLSLHIVPARDPVALSDILNAGWKAFHDPTLWENTNLDKEQRDVTLKELLLKSVEVLEVQTRLREST